MTTFNERGFFPYTPATNLLFGLHEALATLNEEGLQNVFARHDRLAEATRAAVAGWGLEVFCANAANYSSSITAVLVPEGHDADELRRVILNRYDMSLGNGLGQLKGKVFRIGHLGDLNDLMLAGTLCGIEMGLRAAEMPHSPGGVAAALDYLGGN
jgi:alanine-glyoxylate transaminase/serine-glyoxylate transaminase/serine-pyruvate transaminase